MGYKDRKRVRFIRETRAALKMQTAGRAFIAKMELIRRKKAKAATLV